MNPQIKHAHAHANASARARLPLRVLRAARCGTSRLGVGKDRIELARAHVGGPHTLGHGRSGAAPHETVVARCMARSDRVEFGASRTHCDGRVRSLCLQGKTEGGAGINGTKEHRRSVGSRLLIWERCGRDAMRRARGRTARSKSGAWFFGTDNRAPRWVLQCGGRCMEPVRSNLPGGLLAREFVAGDGRSTLTTSAKV